MYDTVVYQSQHPKSGTNIITTNRFGIIHNNGKRMFWREADSLKVRAYDRTDWMMQ